MLSTVVLLSLCLLYRRRRSRSAQQFPSRGGSLRTQAQRDADNSDLATTHYNAAEEPRPVDRPFSEKLLLTEDSFGELHHRCLLDTERHN